MNPSAFDLGTALTNLSAAFTSLETLIVAVTYMMGAGLIVMGIMRFKTLATQTMSSAQKGDIAGPTIQIFVGSLLMYLPSTFNASIQTVFGTSTIGQASELAAYTSLSGIENWTAISNVVVEYMFLIGLIAFVRGWLMLSKLGHANSQQGNSIGKGVIHVIGGVLLINIVDTVQILAQTFGYTGG